MPFIWVDRDAAGQLPDLPVAAVDGKDVEFTGRMYLRRAWCRYPEWLCTTVDASRAYDPALFVDEVQAAVAARLGIRNVRASVARALENLRRIGSFFFVFVGPPVPTREAIEHVAQELKDLRLLLFSDAERPSYVTLLEPPIGDREDEALDDYALALSIASSKVKAR